LKRADLPGKTMRAEMMIGVYHRLQPLGHLTAARNLGIRQPSVYGNRDSVGIVPEIVPISYVIYGDGPAIPLRTSLERSGFFWNAASPQLLLRP
jgi:hypothetical protein